ncbi:MAG: phosphate/phosphite/phosphonate ABC transporter substrate-binding protein [Nocardioides sp.]
MRTIHAVGVIFIGLILAGCGGTDGSGNSDAGAEALPTTLRVGIIPNIAPEEQQAKYEPFGDYLAEQLDLEVELFVAADYAGVVAALASDRIDIAYLGGLTYAQAEQQADVTPLVTEVDAATGTTEYESVIVVKADSDLKSTADLVDSEASFAFGDPASTSGSLYPRIMLTAAGVTCDTVTLTECPPLKSVTFTGANDATAQAVLSGAVDAGGMELRVLKRLEADGTIAPGKLRVIDTALVQGYPWVARDGLGAAAQKEITDVFLGISDPELLDLLRAEDYVAVTPADYDEVRTKATELGLLTDK